MNAYFYDIESLENVFTLANFKHLDNHVEIYHLVDDPIIESDFEAKATERIHAKNKNFKGTVSYHDLKTREANELLVKTFGLSDAKYACDPDNKSSYPADWRLVCDTDTDYDEAKHPYLMGYNSYNYDTVMYILYANEVFRPDGSFSPTKAEYMRQYNDELFAIEKMSDGGNPNRMKMPDRLMLEYKNPARPSLGYLPKDFKNSKYIMRKNLLLSGRHLDVAKLNEKQSKVGLKRILGMKGYQILESDKLRPGQAVIENFDQLLDLIAYNVSDVVNLQKLMEDKTYKSAFMIKKQMLIDYPDLIYQKQSDKYAPNISPHTVRQDRLMIDSSSAQLATKALCPYGHLHDYDVVSFMYPSAAKAKLLGIKQVNVLEESRKFFHSNFIQPEVRACFDAVYDYYKSIEGKNFNASENYLIDHNISPDQTDDAIDSQLGPKLKVYNLASMPVPNTFMFYFNKDGSPSNCFVNFSTGGIHGAEYNKRLYEYDLKIYEKKYKEWQAKVDLFNKVKALYPNPCDIKRNKGCIIDNIKYKPSDFLKPKATVDNAEYKDLPEPPKKPEVFKQTTKDGKISWSLDSRYAYTSAAKTQHEDFTSYYPNLLRMMDAFYNEGLGYDRYGEIFDNKTKFGKLMKDESIAQPDRALYSVMRDGTKLVLNSASGAGDAGFESNIRMNNKIISMRIIGQLFTWRIGQAQTLEGASIISTNTDGLYSAGLNPDFNNMILERESKSINVEIEPEPLYLISKDTNNRVEIDVTLDGLLGKVAKANGGTLACFRGPSLEKSLAHAAILDWAMVEYLTIAAVNYKNLSIDSYFDDEIGMSILKSARKTFNDDIKTLLMFQTIVASSPGTQRFVFCTKDNDPQTAIPMQHYNRCFIVKNNPDAVHLKVASAKVVTEAMLKKRRKQGEREQQHDPIASDILAVNGVDIVSLPSNKEATVTKLTGIEDEWNIMIENNDLYEMSQSRIDEILDSLDYDRYLELFRDSFNSNWMNMTPELEEAKLRLKEELKTKKPCTLFDESGDINPATIPTSDSQTQNTAMPVTENTQIPVDSNNADPFAKCMNPPETHHEPNKPFSIPGYDLPVMIPVQSKMISGQDIANAEKCLCLNGIREDLAGDVLDKVSQALIKTPLK